MPQDEVAIAIAATGSGLGPPLAAGQKLIAQALGWIPALILFAILFWAGISDIFPANDCKMFLGEVVSGDCDIDIWGGLFKMGLAFVLPALIALALPPLIMKGWQDRLDEQAKGSGG